MRLTHISVILLAVALFGLGCPPSKPPPSATVAAQGTAASAPDVLTSAPAAASTGPASTSEPASHAAAPSASATASAAPVAASAAPTAEPVARPALPTLPTTIGDTTCTKDADCRLTRRLDCCDCCKGNTRATSRAWLSWRDGTLCKQTRCEPCGKVKCAYYEPADKYAARCERGSCVLGSK